MSSDAPRSLSDDPASINFWLEHYKGTCDTYAAENVRLKGEVTFLKRRHLEEIEQHKGRYEELKGKYDALEGKHDALKDENTFLRRQLGLAEVGQVRTPSRATTSEREIGLRTPPSSSKGTSPPLNVRRAPARGPAALESVREEDEESSSEDENLADFARRIRAQRGGGVGPGRRLGQRQERRSAKDEDGVQWGGPHPHPIRWGPKPGAKKDKGKEARKRDAPDESSGSDTPLSRRRNVNERALRSSKRMRLEGVFPPPLTMDRRRGCTPLSATLAPSSSSRAALADTSEDDEEDEEDGEDEDEDEDEGEGDMDDLFSLTSLTPVPSRPSSPMHIDPVGPQEPGTSAGPHPPEESREPEASAPSVRHFRSPSRELSYFDPVPRQCVPTPAAAAAEVRPTQSRTIESQVETLQIEHCQPPSAGIPTVPVDPNVNSSGGAASQSFADRVVSGLVADSPHLHSFSVAARPQPFPVRHAAFPPARASTSTLASTSRAPPLPPPPPAEMPMSPQTRRPLDIARARLRQEAQRTGGASTLNGSGARLSVSLQPATTPPRATALASLSSEIPSPALTAPRPMATVLSSPTSSPLRTSSGPAVKVPPRTALPLATASTSQHTAHVLPLSAATIRPTTLSPSASPHCVTAPLTTALSMVAPAPAPTIASQSASTRLLPTATQNSGSQTPSSSLSSSSRPAQAEAGPSQPSRIRHRHPTTRLLPGDRKTKIGPPLLNKDELAARLAEIPEYAIVADDSLLHMVFTREFISQMIGGSSKWKCTVARDGRPLLFGNLTSNSHLPESPGFPGLLCHANLEPDWKEEENWLFLEVGPAEHWYLGIYKIKNPATLTKKDYKSWPLETKRKWAEDILKKTKHREIRERIVKRRDLGRQLDNPSCRTNTDVDDYKNLSRDEIIEAYELGHETMYIFPMQCVGYDVALMRDAAERLPAYLVRRAEHNAVQAPRASAGRAARPTNSQESRSGAVALS